MKKIIKKGIAVSLAIMLSFEAIPVHSFPFHFRSYAKTSEEVLVDAEINELETEEELEEYNRNDTIDFEDKIVTTSIESDFEIDENGVLIAYHGTDENVIIPNSVTSIGEAAFYKCSSLTNIEIPNSVISISNKAFWGCSSLTSIEIPNSVTSIGDYTFLGCSSLTSIELSNSIVSIGGAAFVDCSSLISIKIPNSVTSIGWGTFWGCSSLISIELPNSIISIGEDAFHECSSLTSIELPNSITSIGERAFLGCSSLISIELPNSVTSICVGTFSRCSSLTNIKLPNSIASIGKGAFFGCSSLISIELPNSIASIGGRVFSSCSSLTSIEIPNSVTLIGDNAFSECSSLTSIKLSNSVTSIGVGTFSSCSSLTSIKIPNSVTSIEAFAFSSCSSLTNIEFSNSITLISANAFFNCSSLTSIKIPNSVTSIYAWAFSGCSSLTSIELPNSVTSIHDFAFDGCSSLTIYCYENSYAKTYAKEQNIPYKIINSSDEPEEPANIEHIKSISPAHGYQYKDLSELICEIEYDQNIKECNDNCSISLVEYVTDGEDKVVEQFDLKGVTGVIDEDERSKNVSISASGNTLIIYFNKNWKRNGTLLSADTKYYILLEDNAIILEDGSVPLGIHKDDWSFKTLPIEHSLIKNAEATKKIDSSLYQILYKPLQASIIENWRDDGSKGVCFGFCYATGAWDKQYGAIKSIGANKNTLKNFQLDTKGNLNYTFLEYIHLAHIYQYSSYMQKILKENEVNEEKTDKYDKLYEAIRNYQNKKGLPIIFGVCNSENIGHVVIPLGILSENSNEVIIEVYNCNGEGVQGKRFVSELVLKKENGKFVDWEFLSYNERNEDNGKKGSFQFCEIDQILDEIVLLSLDKKESSNLVFSQVIIDNLNEINSYTNTIKSETEDQVSKHLYWIEDNMISRLASDARELSEIGITDGNKEVSANVPLNADITLDINKCEAKVSLKETSDYNITYREATDYENIQSTTIYGKAVGDILTEQREEGIVLTGNSLSEVEIVTKHNDDIISKVTFSSSNDHVLIEEKNNTIIVSEDSNGDGIFDKQIGNSSNNGSNSEENNNSNTGNGNGSNNNSSNNTGSSGNHSGTNSSFSSDDDDSDDTNNDKITNIKTVSSTGKWVKDQTGWWYQNVDNSYPANKWQLIDGKWYFFNKAGYMVTGWILSNGKWYYLGVDGAMVENSWILDKEKWYFLKGGNGDMATGWILWNNQWYYLNPDGSMKTGWFLDKDIWYYLNKNGDMAVSCTTPDGYQVDKNGAWMK